MAVNYSHSETMQANTFTEIGQIVRYHRKKGGLSQLELARIAGVGKTAVFDIEHGKKTMQLNTLMHVLKVLNISLRLDSPLMENYKAEKDATS